MILAPLIVPKFFDNNGAPLNKGQLFCYVAGSTTKQTTYTDSTGGTPNTNPVILDFRGECSLWLDTTKTYKFVLAPATDTDPPTNPFWTRDNVAGGYSGTIDYVQIVYDRTAAELVTPVNLYIQPGYATRQETNTIPGTTDMQPGLQASWNAMSSLDPLTYIKDNNLISKPLLYKSTFPSGGGIIGNGCPEAIISPSAVDIKQAPQNINCMIFNQNNNPHLHLQHMRFTSSVAFTGVCIYSVENGGADSSGQCIFSAFVEDIFVDTPSTNGGFSTGGWQNSAFERVIFENQKTVFNFQGTGIADNFFTDIALYNCYDSFILQTADTNGSAMQSVKGLHAYNHNRGRLFDIQNWTGGVLEDITLEPASGNLGDTGLFRFNNCTNILANQFISVTRSGVPACAVGIEIKGATSAKFANGYINADVGILFSDTGAVDIELVNVDFTACTTAAIRFTAAVTGTLRTRGCKFNNSQLNAILSSSANGLSWYSVDDECLNAGLAASAGSRNISLNTSGTVRITNMRLGQNNGSAAASFYMDNAGSGTVTLVSPQIVGTPPSGLNTGAQALLLDDCNSSMNGMTQFVPGVGGSATYTGTPIGFWSIKNKMVDATFDMTINAIGTGATSQITNLPFLSHATAYGGGLCHFFSGAASTVTGIFASVAPGGQAIQLRSLTAAGAATANNAIFQNGTRVIGTVRYPVP